MQLEARLPFERRAAAAVGGRLWQSALHFGRRRMTLFDRQTVCQFTETDGKTVAVEPNEQK